MRSSKRSSRLRELPDLRSRSRGTSANMSSRTSATDWMRLVVPLPLRYEFHILVLRLPCSSENVFKIFKIVLVCKTAINSNFSQIQLYFKDYMAKFT